MKILQSIKKVDRLSNFFSIGCLEAQVAITDARKVGEGEEEHFYGEMEGD